MTQFTFALSSLKLLTAGLLLDYGTQCQHQDHRKRLVLSTQKTQGRDNPEVRLSNRVVQYLPMYNNLEMRLPKLIEN